MFYDLAKVYQIIDCNYFYYLVAKSFARHITIFFVMVDHIFQLNMIVPTAPWNLYRTNA